MMTVTENEIFSVQAAVVALRSAQIANMNDINDKTYNFFFFGTYSRCILSIEWNSVYLYISFY